MSASRSRSRSPIQKDRQEPCKEEIDSDSEGTVDEPPTSADQSRTSCSRVKFYMENIPALWGHREVKEFMKKATNSSSILRNIKFIRIYEPSDIYPVNGCCVIYGEPSIAREAYGQLKVITNMEIEGKFIRLSWRKTPMSYFLKSSSSYIKDKRLFLPTKTEVSQDTYGLSKEFLDQACVKLPISNKIFVANLAKHVDENKLREVFSNAGQIIDLFILCKGTMPKMAKIEYDHPLEAVQAICMFHNQELYGRQLLVQIDNLPDRHSKPFPEGLASIGPGLGPNGAPMRNMRYVAEIQPLKDLLNSELVKLKILLASAEQSNMNQSNGLGMMNASVNMQTMAPLNINTISPFSQPMPVANPFGDTQGLQNLQVIQGLLQQNVGGDSTSTRSQVAIQTQNVTPTFVGFGQQFGTRQSNWNSQSLLNTEKRSRFDQRERNSEEIEKNTTATDMLIFNNLPASVTLSVLKNKMREVGEYKFVELTHGGKAIVRFCRVQDAERCVKLFDRSKVDGQLIQVKYF